MVNWRDSAAVEAEDKDLCTALHNSRSKFSVPSGIYLCGNSLGAQPLLARKMLMKHMDKWGKMAAGGHFEGTMPWASIEDVPAALAMPVVGAEFEHEVAYMNSLTVNIHLMLTAFYRPEGRRRKILLEAGAFPSDEHALATHVAARGLDPEDVLLRVGPRPGERLIAEEDLLGAVSENADDLALVFMPGVMFTTGQLLPLAALCEAAQRHGIPIGFDLAHAVGNVPLALHAWGADFAVWCSYKYLNGGPGAVAGVFLHDRHADAPLHRLAGWWGVPRAERFKMRPEFVAQHGARGFQLSNVPVLSVVPVIAALMVLRDAGGVKAVRQQSLGLTRFLERALDDALAEQVEIVTPRDPAKRGAQLSLRVRSGASAREIEARLGEHNVFVDSREPDLLRVAPAPLYCTYADVVGFVRVLEGVLGGSAVQESGM